MHFAKFHGLGNDFILTEGLPVSNEAGLRSLARYVCDRHFGVGADGLILVLPGNEAPFRMRILNSDGSEAEMCGNAIRCAAKYLYERGLVRKRRILVETLAGMRVPELIIDNGKVALVRVDMGEPLLERGEIPMLGAAGRVVNEELFIDQSSYRITAVSMGNPHCIVFVPDLTAVELTQLGPRFENHPSFPRKTNVEFVQVLNRAEVRMAVWERGAGVTLACGTGACAVGVAGALNGFTNRAVTVHLSTGELYIEWAADNHVYMTGPAEEVFSGSYPIPE